MNYLAFDIEAANGYLMYSICSIGYVLADENFVILKRDNLYINPKAKYNLNGTRKNVGIDLHLDKTLLDASPDFAESYEKIRSLLTSPDVLVVGHAVESDVRMLNAACKHYKLPSIDFSFVCSQLLYRLYKKERDVKALNKIACELGLEYSEHNSEDDAWMSLKTLEFLTKANNLGVDLLMKKYGVRYGRNRNYEITRTLPVNESAGKKSVGAVAEKIKNYLAKNAKKHGVYEGKVFSLARSLEFADDELLCEILNAIASGGGKYSSKLSESNVYVQADQPTRPDLMREKRVAELKNDGSITVMTVKEITEALKK